MRIRNISHQGIRILFLILLAACNAPTIESLSTDTPQTAGQNWVIFSQKQAEEQGIVPRLVSSDNFWTPSNSDILKIEDQIVEFLHQNHNFFSYQPPVWERLDQYQSQFFGLKREGKQIIYGNYFCDNFGKDWKREFVSVLDGGECYFQIEYDLHRGEFIKLMVNGES